jgi:hypothetical protein
MTKVCISFAAASGLSGFPDFPSAAAQQLQAEFPEAKIVLARSSEERKTELADADVLVSPRLPGLNTDVLTENSLTRPFVLAAQLMTS